MYRIVNIMKNKISKKIFFYFLSLLLLLIFIKTLDFILSSANNSNYLFRPNSKMLYKTSEFNTYVNINKFGFRGNEKIIKKNQIVVVGDSFTFGYGNNDNEIWPKLLEEQIKESKLQFNNVYNLGVPGTNILDTIKTADKYFDKFKPKILIISFNSSSGIQDGMFTYKNKGGDNSRNRLRIKNMFPNIYFLFNSLKYAFKKNENFNVLEYYKNAGVNYLKKENNYDNELINLINEGNINPNLLYYANLYPNLSSSFWNNFNKKKIEENLYFNFLINQLNILKSKADYNDCAILLLPIADAKYVDSLTTKNYKRYGFNINDIDLNSNISEQTITNFFEEKNKIMVIKTLNKLRNEKKEIYFPYDGHLNYNGNKIISDIVLEFLKKNF